MRLQLSLHGVQPLDIAGEDAGLRRALGVSWLH